MYDPKYTHVEMLASGLWAILNPDGSRFDAKVFKTRGAAQREWLQVAPRRSDSPPPKSRSESN
jgi:hypothetical protein